MKFAYITLTIFFLSSLSVFSQEFSKDMWHRGEIDLENGETLKGKIKYNLDENNIVFQAGAVIRSLNPTKVEAWQIIDTNTKQVRYFYTLPYSHDRSSYKKPTFFELLTEGDKLTLLTREDVVEKIENQYDPYFFGGRNVRMSVLVENYFFMNSRGQIISCPTDIDDLMKFMGDKESQIKKFIKTNKLKIERRENMIQIVDYYNSLQQS
ncbi:hypothetical protein R9C00_16310 [Flammeovirgaceae bacterium SG7u.111]|nr:hypothetical protein [Flammeovirgaceae bacterium SG7u.132]WPO33267.1 hypothetical protein R9C00_16310 [Flammeovirgaceae bacterium SG7u.111]